VRGASLGVTRSLSVRSGGRKNEGGKKGYFPLTSGKAGKYLRTSPTRSRWKLGAEALSSFHYEEADFWTKLLCLLGSLASFWLLGT